jgi:hypothetical protein
MAWRRCEGWISFMAVLPYVSARVSLPETVKDLIDRLSSVELLREVGVEVRKFERNSSNIGPWSD